MAFAPVLNLADLNGSNGFRIDGVAAGDFSGNSVSSAGDVNGDGFDDLVIGARGADPNGSYSGSSYVVFGRGSGFSSTLNLSSLNGSNGFRIDGVAAFDRSGRSVSSAGDVNGDGIDDLIIGAPDADSNGDNSGSSYVVFGRRSGFDATLNLSSLNGSTGFRIDGTESEQSGHSVSNAGDVNGDGIDDLIIGILNPDNPISGTLTGYSGSSYVVFGRMGGFDPTLNLSSLNGTNGFRIDGVESDQSGRSVSGAGDINGDGIDDLIIGILNPDNPISGTLTGYSGSSYVVFGRTGGFGSTLNLSSLSGSTGFRLDASVLRDNSPYSVSGAGDINGDGFDDLIIGALNALPNGFRSGSSYVVFGRGSGFGATLDLTALDGNTGFRLDGMSTYDYSGAAVSGAGDINGDGFDDLIIGARGADPNGEYSGSSYIVFGRASGFEATLNLASLNGNTGFRLDGAAAYDYSGVSVSSAGDINGDGFNDLIIGASGAGSNGTNSGSSYVVFGRRDITIPSPFDDVLRGTANADTIRALEGNDVVRGLEGDDRLFGDAGNDRLFGDAGIDRLYGGTGDDRLDGGTGSDRLSGESGRDTLYGGTGDDLLIGSTGNDRLFGESGRDTLYGGTGDDRLDGGTESDRLFGDTGRDTLIGGSGDDRLDGGIGNDVITTGTGRDVIVIRQGDGFDRVTDFQNSRDRIDLVGLRFGQLSIVQQRDDVLIKVGSTNLMRLEDTNVSAIDRADFV